MSTDPNPTIVSRQRRYLNRISRSDTAALIPSPIRIPRGVPEPKVDSHLLALSAMPSARGQYLDMFSGSGAVALWLINRVEGVVLSDISPAAVHHLRGTFAGSTVPVHVNEGDVFNGIDGRFDLITANPPYTDCPTHSPPDRTCFDPGHQSLLTFLYGLQRHLEPGGVAFVTWASFAGFSFIEAKFREIEADVHCWATLSEPVSPGEGATIEYRVYSVNFPIT